jgi:hypothetical protein
MKKLAFIILTISSIEMYAQKNSYLVSGNVSYNQTNNSDDNVTNNHGFNFNPKIGYQFSNNFTVGVESNIGHNSWTIDSNNYESKREFFSIGSFLRYSKTLNDSFSLFADLGVGYQTISDKLVSDNFPGSNSRANGFYTSINPLLHLKVKNGFGLNFGLGGISYSFLENEQNNNSERNFRISFGQAFTVGIQKVF